MPLRPAGIPSSKLNEASPMLLAFGGLNFIRWLSGFAVSRFLIEFKFTSTGLADSGIVRVAFIMSVK